MNYFIPPSLYFKLLTAYRKGSVKIPNDYKHLDIIEQDKLFEPEIVAHHLEDSGNLIYNMPEYSGRQLITTAGKALFFSVSWRLAIFLLPAIGAIIGWAIAFFV